MHPKSLLYLPLCALLSVAAPTLARETVLEDSPSRLVLEIEASDPVVHDLVDGQRVVLPGFPQASTPGAPDLPLYGFQVATGARTPSVSIEALEWAEVAVPKGLAGVQRPINTRETESAHDRALFEAAKVLHPQTSESQLYRGMALRGISLTLATYSEGSAKVRVLKKFRVTVTFQNPSATPALGVKPWLVQADVKNPVGGQYLVSIPRRAPLRRSAASTLSTGSYIKIKVGDRILDGFEEDGMYTLTFEAAKAANLQIASVDTGKIRIFAGPNDVLDISMGGLLGSTLREIPIEVVEGSTNGNPNGTFDAGDQIRFYAHGTSLWKPIVGATGPVRWEFKYDPYSFENYYYVDWSGPATGALRLNTVPFVSAATTVTTTPHYLHGEKDLSTGACDPSGAFDSETGYEWYWFGRFSCNSTSGSTRLTGTLLNTTAADLLTGRVSDTAWIGFFSFGQGSSNDYEVSAPGPLPYTNLGINGAWYPKAGLTGELLGLDSVRWLAPAQYNRFEGYTVRYTRQLAWAGKARKIFPAGTGERIAYQISGVQPGFRVLRIESGVARKALAYQTVGTTITFSDSAGIDEDVHYFLYETPIQMTASALTAEAIPTAAGVIQNLTTGDNKNPEYLIITPQVLLPEAVKLRDYRDNDARSPRLTTSVVRVEDIYREWSGGRLSPVAIRDFIRWALNRWGAGSSQGNLKYVVLLGDGHYDYRNIRNSGSNAPAENLIPPFNMEFGDNNPMNTDDFFSVLDSGESWTVEPPDISLGRLPFQSRDQADNYLDKISRYENAATSKEWRSRFLLIGDDDKQQERPDGIPHTAQAETLGNRLLEADPGMRKEQVYLYDYPTNSSYLKPAATQALIDDYNRGVLFSTFFGHGAYNQMADEVLLKTSDGLARFRNVDQYFMMSIFSCTVGRFEKLADEGMSEQFLRMANGGSIATVSASRESYDIYNAPLGYAFATALFSKGSDSAVRPVGDALRLAKSQVTSSSNNNYFNRQKYILQGEPVTLINRPDLGVELDSVPDSLQSLGCDTLRGRVNSGSGKGKVNLRIIAGDIPVNYTSPYSPANVLKPGQTLFERTVDYDSSKFSIGYFLPKNVPFGDNGAKIQLFAWDATQLRESAVVLSNRSIVPGGTCVVDADGLGPRIAVTGCNTKESGGIDFPDKVKISLPYCLQITVNDTVGGVLPGDGPDEGTTVEVVGSVAPFHPQVGVDDLYTKTYQMTLTNQDLVPGTHLLKVSARDGFGNRGTREISLQVSADTALRFIKAFNVPNPMKRNGTTFHFQTTLPSEEGGALTSPRVDRVNFHLRIFNQQGYMVQEFRNAVSGETKWDGKDAWGRQLANGVYFYQVTASWNEGDGSPEGGRRVSKKNVLVISR